MLKGGTMIKGLVTAIAALLVGAAVPGTQDRQVSKGSGGENPMLYSVETDKSMAKIGEDLPKACAARKFGVLSVINLKEKMKEKGVEYAGECLIFEVCNPQRAKQTLEANPEISTALPCRISAFRTKDGKIRLATLRPSKLIELFGTAELAQVAGDVEASIVAIMDEAAR
jgi:uncharacterized protein (DUF302 family)